MRKQQRRANKQFDFEARILADFFSGASVAYLADVYHAPLSCVEHVIRVNSFQAFFVGARMAGRADQHEAAPVRRPVNRSGRGGSGRRRLSRPTDGQEA